MARVLATGLFLYPERVGGTEQYFNNLLKGWVENGQQTNIDLLLNKTLQAGFAPQTQYFNRCYVRLHANRAFYDLLFPYLCSGRKYQVYFSPNYITPLRFWSRSLRLATTIHDLQYLHYPQFFSFAKRHWQYLAHLHTVENSDAVICISDYVRQDVIDTFGGQYAHKLHVIHNAVDYQMLLNAPDLPMSTRPFILAVSAHFPHKNLLNLVRAFNLITQRYADIQLRIVGQWGTVLFGGDYEAYSKRLRDLAAANPNIIFTGYISELELANYYRNCLFLAYPSLFEGFGLPVAEAMGIGIPVLTTRTTALPEVSQNQAKYIQNPQDIEEIAYGLVDCLDNLSKYRQQAQGQAPAFREHYALSKVADKYSKIFDEIT